MSAGCVLCFGLLLLFFFEEDVLGFVQLLDRLARDLALAQLGGVRCSDFSSQQTM